MTHTMTFGEIVEQADSLSLDEQQALLDLLRQRTIQQRRAQLVKDVRSARKDHRLGRCREMTPAAIMRDILK